LAESSLATTAEQLSEQGKLVQKLANDIGLLEKQVKRSSDQATQSAGAVKRQMAKALEARVREKETRANTVALETYKGVGRAARARQGARGRAEVGGRAGRVGEGGRGRHAEMQATKKMTELKVDTGVRSMYTSVPARVAENTNAEQLSVRHMAAVLNGTGARARTSTWLPTPFITRATSSVSSTKPTACSRSSRAPCSTPST
jgi:hypothetical protein